MAPKDKDKDKDKGKSKRGRGHKSTSKSGNPASTPPSGDAQPDYLGFLYQIDALETIYDHTHQPRILSVAERKGNDIARLWFPPVYANQFSRRAGNLYRWLGDGDAELVEDDERPEKLERFQVASVFFQARQDNFLAVLKDCTKKDIGNEPHGWCQISFHHQPGLMSMVDIGGDRFMLAAPANGCSWMPQVLPEVYNYDTRNPRLGKPPGPPGGLCGRLSLLIAMAAFSAPVTHAETVVSQYFRGNTWTRHPFEIGIGRYQERGVVVTIYLDPEAVGVTAQHLKAFEEGKYGAIFAHDAPLPAPQPTPRATGYTYLPGAGPSGYVPGSTSSIPRIFPTNTAPSGFPASTGSTAPPSNPTMQPMITDSSDIYDAEDAPTADEPEQGDD